MRGPWGPTPNVRAVTLAPTQGAAQDGTAHQTFPGSVGSSPDLAAGRALSPGGVVGVEAGSISKPGAPRSSSEQPSSQPTTHRNQQCGPSQMCAQRGR